MKRQLSDLDKQQVHQQQKEADGSLRCFISGEIIAPDAEVEYDHIHPFSQNGETTINNIRVVLKTFNRRKSDQSLYDVRDNLRLEHLFESKKNNIRLQDIIHLKDVRTKAIHSNVSDTTISIADGSDTKTFHILQDSILSVDYFYGRVPISWLQNDDQEGLQPRVIDFKRLIAIRDHLRDHPQLAPSIARLLDNRLLLFDGQHKLAAQVLNNVSEIDVKVYISPPEPERAKELFDSLMITNLEAHSKLKQVPFYTSTLLDRLSVIYKELLEEFLSNKQPEDHTEVAFVKFLQTDKQFGRSKAYDMLRSAIKTAALDSSALSVHVAKASRDSNFPITMDLLEKTLFPATLNLEASDAKFTSDFDYRDAETENFESVSSAIVEATHISNWAPKIKGKELTNEQLKARRIWHKGSVLTWAPYLKSILIFALHLMTNAERERLLYRKAISEEQMRVIHDCLTRLFGHPMWDEPEGEMDSILSSAKRQEELFKRKGLTENYVIFGK